MRKNEHQPMKLVPSTKMEPLLMKLLLSDTKYCSLLVNRFEKEWFLDPIYGVMIDSMLKVYKKTSKRLSKATLELLLHKMFPDQYQEMKVRLEVVENLSIDTMDRTILEEEALLYLRNAGISWTLMSNIDEISATHNVTFLIDKLRDLTVMSTDEDMGMDYLDEMEERFTEMQHPQPRMSTGIQSLDNSMAGGVYRNGKCLIVFTGQTHIGKSLMLSNIAANMLRNNKFVVVISLEMSELVYASRIDAHLSDLDINKLSENIDSLRHTLITVKGNSPDGKLLIKEFPPDSISCTHIHAYLEKVISHFNRKIDAVFIDYVTLLLPNNGHAGDNSYTKYRNVTTEMRALSYPFSCPVFTVAQNNRGGYDTSEPSMDMISDSMGIAHTADFVGGLFQKEGDREDGNINMLVMKNRLGGQIGRRLGMGISYQSLKISDKEIAAHKFSSLDGLVDELDEDDDDSSSERTGLGDL